MEAGQELDVLVAEKVMRLRIKWAETEVWEAGKNYTYKTPLVMEKGQRSFDGAGAVPKYSTDIAAAYQVVDKVCHMRPEGYNLHLIHYAYARTYACFDNDGWNEDTTSEGNGEHATAEAICKAALKVATMHKA